jgi:hypothetical protein
MSFLNPLRKKSEEVRVHEIRFLGEQDGPPECLLKNRLADFFRRDRSVSVTSRIVVIFFAELSSEKPGILSRWRHKNRRGHKSWHRCDEVGHGLGMVFG